MTSPILLRGVELAATLDLETAERAARVLAATGARPTLATVLVGDDPASVVYVRMKQRQCQRLGLEAVHVAFRADVASAELVAGVLALSEDPAIDGILVQHPMGAHIDERAVFDAIAPSKDVDGITSASFAAMALGQQGFHSCTPGGILCLLDHHRIDVSGRDAVVVGRSPILGKPMAALLSARDATITMCHSRTRNLDSHLRKADIVVAAVGRPQFIRGRSIAPGAVVIDAGYHPGKVGDVDFPSAAQRASAITPVPGGVGPMTIAVLLAQTVDAAEARVATGLRRSRRVPY